MHGYFPFDSSDPAADWRAARVLDAQRRDESTVSTIAGFYEVTPDSTLTGSGGATPAAGPQLSPAAAASSSRRPPSNRSPTKEPQ